MEKQSGSPAWRLAIDTGSAFTSGCALLEDTGEIYTLRIPSDPGEPSSSALEVLAGICRNNGLRPEKLRLVGCAATLAAGAVTTGSRPVTALLVTRGFRDVLFTGGGGPLPCPYRHNPQKATPLVPRRLTFEVSERMLPGGRIVTPLNENEIIELIPRFKKLGVQSVAVCFLHSYGNPSHEVRVRDILADLLPEVPVTLSSAILPAPGEFRRAVAAVINAATGPLVAEYLDKINLRLAGITGKAPPFFFLQSDASLATARHAAGESARTVLSGPAAGVQACLNLSRMTGRPNLITFDMGATGSRVSLIYREQPLLSARGWFGGHPLGFPMLEMAAGAPGGFSIARVEPGGSIRVGPENSGANPGPACYGRGGTFPTCTDANLLLGRISTHRHYTGEIRPDTGAAREALDKNIAAPLGIPVEQAALKIIKKVNSDIARAVKAISVHKGYDPSEFTLVAFGGAGPQHAAELAADLGIPRVLVPRYPGSYPAMGIFFSDVRREYEVFLNAGIESVNPDDINDAYHRLEGTAREELLAGGVPAVVFHRRASLRFRGQGYEMEMQVPAGKMKQADLLLLNRAYKLAYQAECGLLPEDGETEIASLKLMAVGKISWEVKEGRPGIPSIEHTPHQPRPEGSRTVIFHGVPLETPFYKWNNLEPIACLNGPALVEEEDTTVLVWPGMSASTDLHGNIIIEVGNY